MEKLIRVSGPLALALALVVAIVVGVDQLSQPEDAVARSYSTSVYTEQGGAKMVVASGGEIEIQSGGTLDIQSGASSGFGGNLLVTGTLDVDGAVTLNSTLDVDGNISSGTGAVTVTDSLNVTGAVDLASTLQFGTDNLYALGYASSGYQIVCGTSGTFTATTAVAVSGLTTITHAVVTQITDPADTAAIVSVDAPTTTTLTINSWVVSPTVGVGTTGINAVYCAIGNQ